MDITIEKVDAGRRRVVEVTAGRSCPGGCEGVAQPYADSDAPCAVCHGQTPPPQIPFAAAVARVRAAIESERSA